MNRKNQVQKTNVPTKNNQSKIENIPGTKNGPKK